MFETLLTCSIPFKKQQKQELVDTIIGCKRSKNICPQKTCRRLDSTAALPKAVALPIPSRSSAKLAQNHGNDRYWTEMHHSSSAGCSTSFFLDSSLI